MTFNLEKQPKPVADDGKLKCWEIKSIIGDVVYKIWAETYQQALELLPKIESL